MAGNPPSPGTRAATLGPDFSDSHLSQSFHHEPGNSVAPARHSSSVGGFFAVSFSQCMYFLAAGGLTTHESWPVTASMKRADPAKSLYSLMTVFASQL